jgi:hypothetical protein
LVSIVDPSTANALGNFDNAMHELRAALEREVPTGCVLSPWPNAALNLIELQAHSLHRALDKLDQIHITAAEQAAIDQEDRQRRDARNPSYAVTKTGLNEIHNAALRTGILMEARVRSARRQPRP